MKSWLKVGGLLSICLFTSAVITPYMGAHGHKKKDPVKEAKKEYLKQAIQWRETKEAKKEEK